MPDSEPDGVFVGFEVYFKILIAKFGNGLIGAGVKLPGDMTPGGRMRSAGVESEFTAGGSTPKRDDAFEDEAGSGACSRATTSAASRAAAFHGTEGIAANTGAWRVAAL
jgi:hypothetical protein